MSLLVVLATLVLLAAVILVVSGPLRTGRRRAAPAASAERAELEALRAAKYREIKDAELDYRTGKLSRPDYEAIAATLRADAIEILNRLEALED